MVCVLIIQERRVPRNLVYPKLRPARWSWFPVRKSSTKSEQSIRDEILFPWGGGVGFPCNPPIHPANLHQNPSAFIPRMYVIRVSHYWLTIRILDLSRGIPPGILPLQCNLCTNIGPIAHEAPVSLSHSTLPSIVLFSNKIQTFSCRRFMWLGVNHH